MIKISMLVVFYGKILHSYAFVPLFLIALGTLLNIVYWLNGTRTNFVDGAVTMMLAWAIIVVPLSAFLHLYLVNFNDARRKKYRVATTVEDVLEIYDDAVRSIRIFTASGNARK